MQGDLFRAKMKENDRKRERHHSVSKLLSGVDDMKIRDLEIEKFGYDSWTNEDDVRPKRKIMITSLSISLNICFGAQKNRLIETVLLRTHNICFGWELRKWFFIDMKIRDLEIEKLGYDSWTN